MKQLNKDTDEFGCRYIVRESFGGRVVSRHVELEAARDIAEDELVPVDIWTARGGMFDQGKVIAHYDENGKEGK